MFFCEPAQDYCQEFQAGRGEGGCLGIVTSQLMDVVAMCQFLRVGTLVIVDSSGSHVDDQSVMIVTS